LTEAETAWLTAASKTAARVDKELGRHPEAEEVTRSNLLALATVLRACSRDLARIGRPSQRLQPVYAAIQRACGHYDRAARCVETAASLIDAQAAPGSRADRKINEAMDCLSVGMTAGSTAMVDAKEKSIDIRVASGGL